MSGLWTWLHGDTCLAHWIVIEVLLSDHSNRKEDDAIAEDVQETLKGRRQDGHRAGQHCQKDFGGKQSDIGYHGHVDGEMNEPCGRGASVGIGGGSSWFLQQRCSCAGLLVLLCV